VQNLKKMPHEYSTIVGIQESINVILMNLKKTVLRSNLYRTLYASICVGCVTAQDIILPTSITHSIYYIANLVCSQVELHMKVRLSMLGMSRIAVMKFPFLKFRLSELF